MLNLTREVFDATASSYDKDRSRLIPGCDDFYRWAVKLIPNNATEIVELGAGSGLLTMLVRNRFPNARIHLLDFSQPMLDLAKKRLEGDRNLEFHCVDYLSGEWPRNACAVVSSLSIHHLDDEGKRTVFSRAHQALRPAGVFINAEQVAGPTSELDERYKSWWLDEVRAAGATDQQVTDSLYRQKEDRCSSVELQLAWMREAGFADADCWYKNGRFAVMAGTKR